MARILLLIAIVAVAWYLYRRLTARPGGGTPSTPTAANPDAVTRCEECGVHVPEKNGVRYQERFFCSPEHLNEYRRKNGQS